MSLRTLLVVVVLLSVVPGVRSTWADEAVDSRAAIAESQKIGPGGIDELKAVKIGGIDQWISVRGNAASNPLLLFIHGGPGSPMMPLAWTFQRPWEDYFTVVQWDQRGAGKTFTSAKGQVDPSLSLDRIQADAGELIQYLRQTYHTDKIFLMAHSFGSILGVRLAQEHPEWLYAYIGVGQAVNGRRNEEVSYRETMALAQAAGDSIAVRELKSILPYPGQSVSLESVLLERKWVAAYGGIVFGKKTDDPTALYALSPLYNDEDLKLMLSGTMASVQTLVPDLVNLNYDRVTTFKCPVFFFAGREDRTTPTTIVKDYFASLKAPKKQLFIIEHAAHYVVTEASGEVLVDLVRDVRPLAVKPH